MKQLYLCAIFTALLFPIYIFSLEPIEVDITKFKPVSEFSETLIREIYAMHNLTDETIGLKFFIYDHESMLPESAVTPTKVIFERKFNTVVHVFSETEEFILLSPGLHKQIDMAKPKLAFTALNAFDLLTILEQRKLRMNPQSLEESEQLSLKAKERALKKCALIGWNILKINFQNLRMITALLQNFFN